MSPAELLPANSHLVVTAVTTTADLIAVAVIPSTPTARCPACGHLSDRIHARYRRTLADLAVGPRRLVLVVTARKFRCTHPGCDRHQFCERLDGLAEAIARTTARLADLHRVLGFALGGEPGARVADELSVPTSAELLFQVFADRYERRSLLITSNLPFGEWGTVFQGERMTAALFHRLTHQCEILELTGEIYRFRESMRAKQTRPDRTTKASKPKK